MVGVQLRMIFVSTAPIAGEFITVCLNAHALHLRLEAEPASDAVVQQRNVFVFEFDDSITI